MRVLRPAVVKASSHAPVAIKAVQVGLPPLALTVTLPEGEPAVEVTV